MSPPTPDEEAERDRLIFGAGFAFGVMFTTLILAVVVSAALPRDVTLGMVLSHRVLLPIVSAFLFAAIVGTALYVLALPETGFGLPRPVATDPEVESSEVEK
jgi:glycerol uptake facilitator-like aquaporin